MRWSLDAPPLLSEGTSVFQTLLYIGFNVCFAYSSYRRGKPESNDVDIVFTHPDTQKVKGLCKRLVNRVYERGESAPS